MKKNTPILLIMLLTGCAKKGFPPGGPEDRKPPQVVETTPPVGALNVNPETRIEIRFDEWVKPESVRDAVYISPYPGEDVKIKVSGKTVKIRLPAPLKPDRTTVVTLGTAIRDYRNNALKESFTLAFSTGPVLDICEIAGRVFTDKPAQGLSVRVYRMEDGEDPNPIRIPPDYASQCTESGEFRLTHLAPGRYRMFAVRDRAADRLYDPVEDEYGVTFKDVLLDTLDRVRAGGMLFRMTVEDTIGPALIRAGAVTPRQVTLQFDEPVALPPDSVVRVSIIRAEDRTDTLAVRGMFIDPVSDRRVAVQTDPMVLSTEYEAVVHAMSDKYGHPIDTENRTYTFYSPESPDTARPFVARIEPDPYASGVRLDQILRIYFSESLDTSRSARLVVADTANVPVPGRPVWDTPASVRFLSFEPWGSEQILCVHLFSEGFADPAGNALPDSIWSFRALNRDTLASISGAVTDPDTQAAGPVFVSAVYLGENPARTTLRLDAPGPYRIPELLPGLYRIEAFRDEDGGGAYSYGHPWPYKAAERFAVLRDTVKLRTNWPNEGNDLSLPPP